MADPHLFWKKGWQATLQLLKRNTCKHFFLFPLLFLFMFMFACHTYIHTSHDTPTVLYTHALCLSLSLSLALSLAQTHRQPNAQTHMLTLSLGSLFIYCQGKRRRRSEVGRTEIQRREKASSCLPPGSAWPPVRDRRKPTSDASCSQELRIVWTSGPFCLFSSQHGDDEERALLLSCHTCSRLLS